MFVAAITGGFTLLAGRLAGAVPLCRFETGRDLDLSLPDRIGTWRCYAARDRQVPFGGPSCSVAQVLGGETLHVMTDLRTGSGNMPLAVDAIGDANCTRRCSSRAWIYP